MRRLVRKLVRIFEGLLEYVPTEIERNAMVPEEAISLFIKTDALCMKENELHNTFVLTIQLQLWLF